MRTVFASAALALAVVLGTGLASDSGPQRPLFPSRSVPPPQTQLDLAQLNEPSALTPLPVTTGDSFEGLPQQPMKGDSKLPKIDPKTDPKSDPGPLVSGGPSGPGGLPGSVGPPDSGDKPLTTALNQRVVIRPEGFKGKLNPDSVVVDRPELFTPILAGGATRPFRIVADGTMIELIGIRLGLARVRVFNSDRPDERPFTVLIQVVPDIIYLNQLVRSRFPLSNLVVSAAGDNLLFVDGYVENPGDVEEVEKLLNKFFREGVVSNIKVAGVMQVQLEVVIARVDRTHLRQLGFNALLNNQQSFVGTQIGSLLNTPQVTLPTGGSKVFSPIGPTEAALTGAATAFFGVTDQSKALYGFIEALRQHNVAKVLANPTLVTTNGRQADFLVGGEQPIPVSGTIVAPTVAFKAFGTRLTFLPTVLGGGRVRLDVVPEVSTTNFTNSITVGGLQVPQFVVQRIHATVELQSGQTLCLGGLLQTQIDAQSQKIPLLGDLPWVGTLFRRVRHQAVESELLILVTPRLFNPMEACQVPGQLPGQQTVSPTDAQFLINGALESARRDGGPPIGPHNVPQLGDLIGPAALPAPLSSCGSGSYRDLTEAVCPTRPCAQSGAAPGAP